GTTVNRNTGLPNLSCAKPNWQVEACVSDGFGGWYIGGFFTEVDGQPRSCLARINADGTLNPWSPNVAGTVMTIVQNGPLLYIGGYFTSVGGQVRNRLAAVSTITGAPTSWNPNVDGAVLSIALDGNTIYAGGQFSNIGGQPRSRIGAVDATTGTPTPWNPNANGTVEVI